MDGHLGNADRLEGLSRVAFGWQCDVGY